MKSLTKLYPLSRLNAWGMLNFYKSLYYGLKTQNAQFSEQLFNSLWPDLSLNSLKSLLQNHYTQTLLSNFSSYYQSVSTSAFEQFVEGFLKYLESPIKPMQVFPQIHECGTAVVRDYSQHYKGDRQKPLLLFVPSLINRSYIFDITLDHSLINYLAVYHGFESYVIDWGDPSIEESQFTLDEYTFKRLIPLIRQIAATDPSRKIMVIGYCMGGLLALKALQQCSEIIKMVLLAVPGQPQTVLSKSQNKIDLKDYQSDYLVPALGQQFYFHSLNPQGVFEKFYRYGDKHNKYDHNFFIAIEDWLNDGPALASKVAQELMGFDLITGQSSPRKNHYLIDDFDYSAHSIFVVTPSPTDLIVTSASSQALLNRLPNATVLSSSLGHIGMIISNEALKQVWRPVADWLNK